MSDKASAIYRTRIESGYEFEESDCSESESNANSQSYSESVRNEIDFTINPPWIFDAKLGKGDVSYLVEEEETFWKDVIAAYLKPIPMDDETKKKNVSIKRFHLS